MAIKVELEKNEIEIIYNSLVLLNNRYNEDVKTLKKNKWKYGLAKKENELKQIRKLINFFSKI